MEENKKLTPEEEQKAETSVKAMDSPQAFDDGSERDAREKEVDHAAEGEPEHTERGKKEPPWERLKKKWPHGNPASHHKPDEMPAAAGAPTGETNQPKPEPGGLQLLSKVKGATNAFAMDKKKLGIAVGAVACVVVLVAGAFTLSNSSGLSSELKEAAESRETLTVGVMNTGYPPFLYMDYNGNYTGTDMDLINSVCDYYGWEAVLKPIDWNNRGTVLETGEVDCLWSGFNSFGREGDYAWTEPYLDTSDVIVVKSNNKDIKTLDDLADKTVAAVNDSNAYLTLETIGLALSRMGCEDVEQAGQMVTSGNADAAVLTRQEAETLSGVKILDECLNYNTYAVACKTDNTVLRDLIGYALDQVQG